jgi:hypothetical protein
VVDFRADREQQLEPFAAHISGNPLASLMAVKGKPGAAERAKAAPFSGDDGLALDKAFGRLGWGYGSQDTRAWFGLVLALPDALADPRPNSCSDPLPDLPALSARDLRLICEIIDPLTIVALDDTARTALIEAFISTEEGFLADFTPGSQIRILGRQLVSVEGFEDALSDEAAKQKVWAQLKRCEFSSAS